MSRPGRNAPCPCGSGKKYKKCCLPQEEEKLRPPQSRHDYCLEVADALRVKILNFMKKGRYGRHIDDALDIYWHTLEPDLDPPEIDEYWYMRFIEWFVHDYLIPKHDKPLIQVFLESSPVLPDEEMQVLRDWQDGHISVYQIREVQPEKGALAEDIFSGKEFFINDVSMSREVRKWELITTRLIRVLDEWHCSNDLSMDPPTAKEEIIDFVMAGLQLIQKLEPGLELRDYLRAGGFALHQRLLTQEVMPDEPPEIFTSGGEELTFCEARYDLTDLLEAMARLESQEDFAITFESEDEDGRILECSFSWLEKGQSADKAKKIQQESGLNVGSFFSPGPGQEASRVLGDLAFKPDQVTLEVQGEERFALGKERLEIVLAGLIHQRQETVRTREEMLEESTSGRTTEETESEIPPEVKQAILKEYMDQHYQEWLDTPLPALNGEMPRQAIKTAEGRRLVEDLLRIIEYHHDMDYDVAWLRKELGL